jgi:hypothetical protein
VEALLGLHTGRCGERKRLRFDVGRALIGDATQVVAVVERQA